MFVANGYIINYTKEIKILRFSTCQNIASKERNRQSKINIKNDSEALVETERLYSTLPKP